MRRSTNSASRWALLGVVLSLTTFDQALAATDEATPFLRVRRNEAGAPQALETAVVRYARPTEQGAPLTVDLVAAVHVADSGYYKRLNDLFRDYDAVLYELVAPRDAQIPAQRQRSSNPLSAMQLAMTDFLDLAFQLDCIDYSQKNLVHADLTPNEFAQRMKERGESPTSLFFRLMARSFVQQSKRPQAIREVELMRAMFSKNRTHRLKKIMAEQFEESLEDGPMLDGKKGTTIINERNKRAIEVLTQQVRDGKQRIAIFYGAAHLPDLEERLAETYQMKSRSSRWFVAWDLTDKNAQD